jgi:hypothetical protein
MFTLNSLKLVADGSTDTEVSATGDFFAQRGRSVRKNAAGLQLSISSVKTKENPGYVTTRRNVRLEQAVTGLSNAANPKGKIIAQLTVSKPDDEAEASPEMVAELVSMLVNLLTKGESALTSNKVSTTADFAGLTRVLNDEV